MRWGRWYEAPQATDAAPQATTVFHSRHEQAQGDRHIWARSYERDLRSVLALQGEIARDIVGEVRANLRPTSSTRQVNPESYEAYLRGRHDLNNATSEAELESSISNFRPAIAKDPQSGLAYSGLAMAYAALADFYRAPKEVMPEAKEAATRALHLDETLSEAHDAFGWVEFTYEWNCPVAEQHLKRALELNPDNALAHDHYAYFLASLKGQDEAFAENQLARELDPFSLTILVSYGVKECPRTNWPARTDCENSAWLEDQHIRCEAADATSLVNCQQTRN